MNTLNFTDVKVGDTVTRLLAESIPMQLEVTDVTQDRIICGEWEFDRKSGIEVDDFIPMTISRLVKDTI